MLNLKHCRWLIVAILVITLDRLSKVFAKTYLVLHEPLPVMPSFNLTLTYNKGAAFSFLNSASGWQTIVLGSIAIIVVIALFIWMIRLPQKSRLLPFALSLIIGGALGNLWDRIESGHVT